MKKIKMNIQINKKQKKKKKKKKKKKIILKIKKCQKMMYTKQVKK